MRRSAGAWSGKSSEVPAFPWGSISLFTVVVPGFIARIEL